MRGLLRLLRVQQSAWGLHGTDGAQQGLWYKKTDHGWPAVPELFWKGHSQAILVNKRFYVATEKLTKIPLLLSEKAP